MAWESTPKAEQKKDNLIARLLREDKRLTETEDSASSLALQVNATSIKDKKDAKSRKKTSIAALKKRTSCKGCGQKGHWVRECPNEEKQQRSQQKELSTYVCEVQALWARRMKQDEDIWLADSGASNHMTFRRDFFTSLKPLKEKQSVKIADNKMLPIEGIGNMRIQETVNGQQKERVLSNVLYIPDLRKNLFSITTINDRQFSFHAFANRCEVRDREGKVSSHGIRRGNLFQMLFEVIIPSAECNVAQEKAHSMNKLWHERMGHVNMRALTKMSKLMNSKDFVIEKEDDFFCESCMMGKQTRKPHKSTNRITSFKPGEKIHSDVCGPVNIESPRGTRYFLVFKDECTSFRKVYFLRHKSEVFNRFKEFEAFVENQTENQIKVFRSDNGTEYTSDNFQQHLKGKGIIQEFSSSYIHEQNGRAERDIRTITESARSMIINNKVSLDLWPEAVNTACYLLNRTIQQESEMQTPFEKWFERKPEIKHLRIYGSEAYLNIPKEKRKKFDEKSRKLIFVGYDGESSNYRLWDNKTKKIYISSDVDFNEKSSSACQQRKEDKTFKIVLDFGERLKVDQHIDLVDQQQIFENQQFEDEELEDASIDEEMSTSDQPAIKEQAVQEGRQLRDRNRIQPPERFGVPVTFIADRVPMTYAQAMASADAEKWKTAINEEIQALEGNSTWSLTTLPPGKRAIGCKWVFAIKTNVNSEVRYKARLVAKGFLQKEGIDYFETFAPVIRYESVRILLAIAAKEDYEIMKFDVKTAFLYGNLQEDIYMQQPEGYIMEDKKNQVYKLQRSLYGLKQSSRCWNDKFVQFLEAFNFKSTVSDKCVFVGNICDSIVYLALYVDDGLVMSKSINANNKVIKYLQSNFQITSDEANEYIGFEIERDRTKRTLKISQSKYINKLVDRFGMSESKPSSLPAEPGLYMCKHPKNAKMNESETAPYREAIGALLFAARVCRPDIEYAVNYLSQFVDAYNHTHWSAVKQILRYLSGTRNLGIVFGISGSSCEIRGYTDADYAGCLETRKSRSGFVFQLNGGPISWSSQRQNVVSLSTAEAEYIALAHGTKEAIWLRRILNDLKIPCESIPLLVDNQSAIKLARNSEFHKRSKHIDVRYHFVRDILNRKLISISYVESKEQLADIFTKPLTKQTFCYLRKRLNVLDHPN